MLAVSKVRKPEQRETSSNKLLGCHLPEGLLPLAPPGVNNPGNYRLVRVIYLRIL